MIRNTLIISTFLALAACAATTGAAMSPTEAGQRGRWVTESGNLEVEIAPCGEKLCGTVVKVLANRSMSDPNKPMAANPEDALGMKILSDFRFRGNGEWEGTILNRENGKTYDCVISLVSNDQLKVRSYVIFELIGKTQIWQRT